MPDLSNLTTDEQLIYHVVEEISTVPPTCLIPTDGVQELLKSSKVEMTEVQVYDVLVELQLKGLIRKLSLRDWDFWYANTMPWKPTNPAQET